MYSIYCSEFSRLNDDVVVHLNKVAKQYWSASECYLRVVQEGDAITIIIYRQSSFLLGESFIFSYNPLFCTV